MPESSSCFESWVNNVERCNDWNHWNNQPLPIYQSTVSDHANAGLHKLQSQDSPGSIEALNSEIWPRNLQIPIWKREKKNAFHPNLTFSHFHSQKVSLPMLSQALKTRFKTSIDNAGFQLCVLDLKQMKKRVPGSSCLSSTGRGLPATAMKLFEWPQLLYLHALYALL